MNRKNILRVLGVGVFILLAVLLMTRQEVQPGVDPVVPSMASAASPVVVKSSQVGQASTNNATATTNSAVISTTGGGNLGSPSLSPGTASTSDKTKATAEFEAARAASVLSRTPKGIWANRVPSIEDYISDIPAKHAPALADFRARFPEFDPTDVKHFTKAIMRQRDEYGDTLEESESKLMNAWLDPMRDMQKEAVIARAALVGVALRGSEPIDAEGNSRTFMLSGFDGIDPRYVHTANTGGSEATGANLVRLNPSYDTKLTSPVDGTGLYININDGGSIHQHPEFQLPNNGGSRIIYQDSSYLNYHATHVAGTVGCWGYDADLMGMAPRVWFRSFYGNGYGLGVNTHGMLWPGQKHDSNNPRTGEPEMKSAVSTCSLGSYSERGAYTDLASYQDAVLGDYPYLTYFIAAANDGANYKTVHGDENSCKNAVTIGAVDATTRDNSGNYVSGGNIANFSSRGPTVDGRIKPDLTAKGVGVLSPNSATTTASLQGTSMATPNASGSAMLLVDYITRKLPGHFFRSSTIKALLINTATDRGNAGPDYTYGYGIVNVKAAADIVKRYAENSSTRVVLEDTLSSGQTWTQTYTYDGNGPIRLSLAWIDPEGTADTSPVLVNDLNVRLIDSGGTTYQPFVMPYTTGNGSFAAYDTNLYDDIAVTGNNFTDNVEQILCATPPPGTYTVQVTHSGSLQNNINQPFSLAITGLSGSTPITPVLTSISPTFHNVSSPNNFTINLAGSGFLLGSDVFLRRTAANGTLQEAKGYGIIPVANKIEARFDLATLSLGYWDVVVRTPDGTEKTLPAAFLIPTPLPRVTLYSNNFESGTTGLSLGADWAVADPNKGGVSGPADAQQGTKALVTYVGGNYAGSASYKTAVLPAISTIGYIDVRLEFQRWLGLGSGDTARIMDDNTSVMSHTTSLIDTGWTAQSYASASFANRSSLRFNFTLYADYTGHSFGWNIDDLKVTGVSSSTPLLYPPRFSSTALTAATQGQAYSYTITTSDSDTAGASRVLAATGLPAGLTFTPNGSGGATLSGTPSVQGVFSVSISVSDGTYTTYQNFSLAVAPPGGNTAPVITTSSLSNACQGEAYSINIAATDANGHSLSFSLASPIPTWLSFTDNGNGTATLSGTPIIGALSSYPINVSVFDGFVTTTKTLTLVVKPRANISFSAATASVNEAAGTITLTVNRTLNSYGPVSLSYASANGNASAADYTAVTGNLSWEDGDQTSRTIVVPILQDTSSEMRETFTVTLSSVTGIATIGISVATVTIVDDDPVLVTVAVTDSACAELNTATGIFTLTRTGPVSSPLTVNYSLSGTATNGPDYTPLNGTDLPQLNGTVNFAANSGTVDVVIDPVNDSVYEGSESVILTIESGTGYAPGSTASDTINIADNDTPTVSVAVSATSVREHDGTTTLTFTRSGIGALTVNYAVTGTATSGSDYQSIGTSVLIPRNQPSATVTVNTINDTALESDETLIVTISAAAAYTVAAAPGNEKTITILDDESRVQPVVNAGQDQLVTLAKTLGTSPVAGAWFEWDAAKDTAGDNTWPSSTANVYTWIFDGGNCSPDVVTDARFDRLTRAYAFPSAKDDNNATWQANSMDMQSATFEFVVDVDADNGLIFESGGSTGIQFDISGGALRGCIKNGSATVSYPLTATDKGRFIHAVFVVKINSAFELYVDGELKQSVGLGVGDWSGTDAAGLGGTSSTAPNGDPGDFTGKLALFRYYKNKAFTAAEVTTNFKTLAMQDGAVANLNGSVIDPDSPSPTTTWSVESTQPTSLNVGFANASSLSTTATFSQAGTYVLKLTVDDGYFQISDLVTITVAASGSNYPPVITSPISYTVEVNTPKAIILTAQDAENDPLTYTVVTQPTHGTLSGTEPDLTYTPDSDFVGTDSFTYKANDTHMDSNIGTITLQIVSTVPPVVTNGVGAVSLSPTSVRLQGVLTTGLTATAWFCWGASDGGIASTGNWQHVESVGAVTEGVAFSNLVTGLSTNTTYFYRCYAQNTYGSDWSDTAETFSGTPAGGTGGGGWTPGELSGLVAWYDAADAASIVASAGTVSQWSDKSANGYNLTGSGNPTYSATGWQGTKPAITFDGSDYLRHATQLNFANGVSVAVVYKTLVTTGSERVGGLLATSSTAKQTFALAMDNSLRYDGAFTAGSISANTGLYVRVATKNATANGQTDWINGQNNISSATSSSDSMGVYIDVGATYAGGGAPFVGQVAEVLFIEGVVDVATRENLEGYLAWKWGMQANLPAGHPYKSAPPGGTGGSAVANLAPTAIQADAATLNASLGTAGTNSAVYVYYGTSDGGTNAGSWSASATVGSWTNVSTNVSYAVSGLTAGTQHYYTFVASNAAGRVWASPSWRFATPGAAPSVTVNHAVPHAWLSAINANWSTNYEAAAMSDPDGDGFTTWQEYWSGTDPQDTNSCLKIDSIEFSGSNLIVKWRHASVDAGIPPITIQARSNLVSGSWFGIGSHVPTNGLNIWSGGSSVQGFYRLAVTNAP